MENEAENSPAVVGKILPADEIKRLSRQYLNEIPEQRESDIKAIREWIKTQPHLKENGRTGTED